MKMILTLSILFVSAVSYAGDLGVFEVNNLWGGKQLMRAYQTKDVLALQMTSGDNTRSGGYSSFYERSAMPNTYIKGSGKITSYDTTLTVLTPDTLEFSGHAGSIVAKKIADCDQVAVPTDGDLGIFHYFGEAMAKVHVYRSSDRLMLKHFSGDNTVVEIENLSGVGNTYTSMTIQTRTSLARFLDNDAIQLSGISYYPYGYALLLKEKNCW